MGGRGRARGWVWGVGWIDRVARAWHRLCRVNASAEWGRWARPAHRLSGFKPGNPYNEKVWDLLESHKIVLHHFIAQVRGGGLNISEDKGICATVHTLLESDVFKRPLAEVIKELVGDA